MFKVGDKVVCIKCENSELDPNMIYTVAKTRVSYYGPDSISLTEYNNKIGEAYYFFRYDKFVSLKEFRKEKLQKLCSKMTIL